jgi:hypothetical protein
LAAGFHFSFLDSLVISIKVCFVGIFMVGNIDQMRRKRKEKEARKLAT